MVDVFGPKIGGGYSTTLSEEGTTAVLTVWSIPFVLNLFDIYKGNC